MPGFVERNITVTYVTCGAFHNACLTSDGDCMTWGSNAGNCLGRPAAMARKEQGECMRCGVDATEVTSGSPSGAGACPMPAHSRL